MTYPDLIRAYAERGDSHLWTDASYVALRLPPADMAATIREVVRAGDHCELFCECDWAVMAESYAASAEAPDASAWMRELRPLLAEVAVSARAYAARKFARDVEYAVADLTDAASTESPESHYGVKTLFAVSP